MRLNWVELATTTKFLEKEWNHYTSSQIQSKYTKLDKIFAKFPKISEKGNIYLEAEALLVPIF